MYTKAATGERLSIGVCPKEFPSFYKYNREKKEPSQTVLYGPGFPCFDMLQQLVKYQVNMAKKAVNQSETV